jgi:anti-sigma regulatory factor (Ser/Thr protein kinase)
MTLPEHGRRLAFGAFALGGPKESKLSPRPRDVAATAPRFDRMVPAAPDTIGALRRELRRWARRQGASPQVQAGVALAFSEAATSIVGAGGRPDREEPGPLMLQAWVDGDELGLRVSHRSLGLPSPPGEVGYGFGLALIARLCERFEVRRREDRPGTALLMIFRLDRSPEPERSSPLRPSHSTLRR